MIAPERSTSLAVSLAAEVAPAWEEVPLAPSPESLITREWLIANGLGGYASGTLAGAPTRRYHGLLVAAQPAPLGRMLMLGQVQEVLRLPDGTLVRFGGELRAGQEPVAFGTGHLKEFRVDWGLPVWTYEAGGFRLEKRVVLAHRQNTVHVFYRLTAGEGVVRLEIHPSVHFRPHDAPVSTPLGGGYQITACEGRYELISPWPNLPPLRLALDGLNPTFTVAPRRIEGVYYSIEDRRG
jgi:glycogen debranching enzyme-like protein